MLDLEAGKELAAAFPTGSRDHQNRGLFTVGTTVDEGACYWFVSMERSCQAQLLAMAAGTPKLIEHSMAQYTLEQTGSHAAG